MLLLTINATRGLCCRVVIRVCVILRCTLLLNSSNYCRHCTDLKLQVFVVYVHDQNIYIVSVSVQIEIQRATAKETGTPNVSEGAQKKTQKKTQERSLMMIATLCCIDRCFLNALTSWT